MSGTGLLQQPLCDSLVPIMMEEIQGLSSGSLLFSGRAERRGSSGP